MNEVKLYINNQEIEFQTSPDILFTYQVDDLTNPTVVKNSYTKTITIPGTKQNNIIFDGIWNVERIQTEENFNVTKRVPFTLYINGDIYQTGYAKLDKITKQNNKYEYSITLYGGLGSFLYNLSIDWNTGDKKTLADLDYYPYSDATTPLDLGFTINKDTVASAWTEIQSTNKWGVVNFAPTYLGHPDKINCDKVLINFSGSSLTSAVTSGDTAYTPSGGFALGTLPQQLTEEEVRDYRSYIQTPVIRVKSIIEAICRKSNNKGRYDEGYDVELDNDFFTPSNPYYWDSWVTLPTITNLEFSNEGGGGGGSTTAYTGGYFITHLVTPYQDTTTYAFELDEPITGGNMSVKITFDLAVTGTSSASNLYMYYTKRYGRNSKVYKRNGYGIQLYASNSVSTNESVLAGSNVKWITGEQGYTYGDAVSSGQFTPKFNTTVVENHNEYFTKVSGSTYHLNGGQLELYCDLPIGTTHFKLLVGRCNSSNNTERTMLFTSTLANTGDNIETALKPFETKTIELYDVASGESISNRYISKEMLLSTEYSPADWLLSYCKKFGLYINKDVVEDKIYIRTRNNFYKRDEIKDIEKDIDYSKQFLINPVYVENGYLSLTDEGVESKSSKDYTQKTGKIYGQKVVNTGYEFNADTKELNNGIFKGAVQAKDVSQYYYKPSQFGLQPFVYNGLKYNLYANGDFSASTYEYTQPQNEITDVCEPFDENYPAYDLVSKPMFTDGEGKQLDTENVMLFYNGLETIPSSYKWFLTDDLSYMYKLNNNPTWLLTEGEYDMAGNKIANAITSFPRFSRWFEGNRWMIYSWDYGSPRLLYVPEFTNNDEGNIYWNYFKKYYEDLYDVDTKVIDCYALGEYDEESMRKFYWFNNAIWRLNKITDYNPTNHDTTKVQFVKVQDVNDMTNNNATSEVWLKIELDRYEANYSGDTLIGTVTTSDNFGWNFEGYSVTPTPSSGYEIIVTPDSYGSSGNFTVTLPENVGDDREITLYFTAGDTGGSVKFIQRGFTPYINLIPSAITFSQDGGVITINVESNVAWNVKLSGETETTGITISGLTFVTDVPASGGTANSANCSYSVIAYYSDSTSGDVTSQAVVSGQLAVASSSTEYRHMAGSLTLTAEYDGFTASASTTVYQSAYIPPASEITGVSFGSISWVTDVPASGGTATQDNCSYTVLARYSNGTNVDITSYTPEQGLFVEGIKSVSASTNESRHSVGSLTVDTYFFPDFPSTTRTFTATTSVTAYQEAYVAPDPTAFTGQYMTFEILSGGYITWKTSSSSSQVAMAIDYSINDGDWETITATTSGESIGVSTGDKVRFRGNNIGYTYNGFGDTTAKFNAYGNIMSMIYGDNFSGETTMQNGYNFQELFLNCTGITSAEYLILPATSATPYCYYQMFRDCTSLRNTPTLPATTIGNYCYAAMFAGCQSLTATTSELPATTLSEGCYFGMYSGCTSLQTSPDLPATAYAKYCYRIMFAGCNSLNRIKCLASSNPSSATSATTNWVSGVSNNGMFLKSANAGSYFWSSGNNGIPVGWTTKVYESGTSIMVGSLSGGTISLGNNCEAHFNNGAFSVDGESAGTVSNSGDFIVVNGGFGWSNITFDEALSVPFSYNWSSDNHVYTNNCYLGISVTDGSNTVSGVIQNNHGVSTVDLDLTPFWTNDTTTHYLTLTINATIN